MATTRKRTTKGAAINLNNNVIFIAGTAYKLKKISKKEVLKSVSDGTVWTDAAIQEWINAHSW